MEKTLYEKAKLFAEWAHADQKYGDEPYAHSHLPEVVQVLVDFGFDDDVWKSRGMLHDVMEDTETHVSIILDEFGPEVAWPCWAVSGFGPNRKIRNQDIKNKIKMFGREAAILKVADRIANCESAGKNDMYRKELPEFAEVVKEYVPVEMWKRLENALNV